jgi:superoxide dismutase, Fe-Mn family
MDMVIDAQALRQALASAQPPLLLDVRRAPAFAQADTMLVGAAWRDPAELQRWAQSLAAGQALVVYCVHGHEVSQGCAASLAALGHHARFLAGGIEGWKAGGGPLAAKAGAAS